MRGPIKTKDQRIQEALGVRNKNPRQRSQFRKF